MKRTLLFFSIVTGVVLLFAACAFPNLPQIVAPAATAAGIKALTVETDASRGQGVLVTESGDKVDIQAVADDGSLVACVAATAVSPIVDDSSAKDLRGNHDAVVIGTRGDGAPGAWAWIGGKIAAMYDEDSGRQTSRLPDADDRNGTFRGTFGWVYHVQGVSEDGKLIAGYAENKKGFTAGGITVDPGTTIGVYWRVSKHPSRAAYVASRAHIIGILDQAKVQATAPRIQHVIGELLEHALGQLKLFLLGFYNTYLVTVDSSGVHLDAVRSVYLVTGSNQDLDPAVATIDKTGVISIALLPPATPGGLTVGSATTTALSVSWTASSNAASYQVYRDTASGGTFAFKAFDGAGTSFTDSGLTSATTYYYKVQATNAGGSSALSAAVSGATLSSGGGGPTVTMAADVNPGAGSSNPQYLTVYGSNLYYSASDGSSTYLHKFDGTSDSTASTVATSPQYLTLFGTSLYMKANSTGNSLYSFDGSTLSLAASTTGINPAYLAVMGSTLYMSATDSGTIGNELWSYDGTTLGNVANINSTSNSSSSPAHLVALGSELYFYANDGSTGRQVWKSDGTTTAQVCSILPDQVASGSVITVFNNNLYFVATTGGVNHLWKSDGGTTASVVDATIRVPPTTGMAEYNGALYMAGSTNGTDYELYKYDGATLSAVSSFAPATGSALSLSVTFGVFGNALYFGAAADGVSYQLYKYDGTSVTLVKTINSGGSANPGQFAVFSSRLYFQATDATNGSELWVLY